MRAKLLVLLFCLSFATLAAVDVPVGPADYTGSRSTADGGITATGSWGTAGFEISWNIVNNNNGTFNYLYSIGGLNGTDASKGISHVLFQVSNNFTSSNITNPSPAVDDGPRTFSPSDPGNSNPGLPGDIFAVKFDTGGQNSATVSFTSDRIPVWGDFYAKDGTDRGQDVYAYNTGFGQDPVSPFGMFIPRPDSSVAVPEPGTLLIIGTGLATLAWRRRRKKMLA